MGEQFITAYFTSQPYDTTHARMSRAAKWTTRRLATQLLTRDEHWETDEQIRRANGMRASVALVSATALTPFPGGAAAQALVAQITYDSRYGTEVVVEHIRVLLRPENDRWLVDEWAR